MALLVELNVSEVLVGGPCRLLSEVLLRFVDESVWRRASENVTAFRCRVELSSGGWTREYVCRRDTFGAGADFFLRDAPVRATDLRLSIRILEQGGGGEDGGRGWLWRQRAWWAALEDEHCELVAHVDAVPRARVLYFLCNYRSRTDWATGCSGAEVGNSTFSVVCVRLRASSSRVLAQVVGEAWLRAERAADDLVLHFWPAEAAVDISTAVKMPEVQGVGLPADAHWDLCRLRSFFPRRFSAGSGDAPPSVVWLLCPSSSSSTQETTQCWWPAVEPVEETASAAVAIERWLAQRRCALARAEQRLPASMRTVTETETETETKKMATVAAPRVAPWIAREAVARLARAAGEPAGPEPGAPPGVCVADARRLVDRLLSEPLMRVELLEDGGMTTRVVDLFFCSCVVLAPEEQG